MRKNHYIFIMLLVIRIFVQYAPAVELSTPFILSFPVLAALILYIMAVDMRLVRKALLTIPIFIVPFLNTIAVNGGRIPLVNLMYVVFQWLSWPLIGYFVVDKLTSKSQKIAFWSFVACFVITALTTSYGCSIFPNASRAMANGTFAEMESDIVTMYRSMNIGSFQFVYTLVLMIPVILCCNLSVFKNRYWGYGIIGLFLYTIYQTQYTTALLLAVVSTAYLVLPISHNPKTARKWLIGIVAIFFVSLPIIGDLLSFFAGIIGSEQMSQRFSELSLSISGQQLDEDSDFGTRLYLWNKSLTTFFSHILTGVYFTTDIASASKYVGGHSFILDSMARFGIVGLMLVIWMFKKLYKLFVKPFNNRNDYIFVFTAFVLNIVQCLINTVSIEVVFVFLMPLVFVISNKENENKYIYGN